MHRRLNYFRCTNGLLRPMMRNASFSSAWSQSPESSTCNLSRAAWESEGYPFLPLSTYWWSFGTKPISPAVFKIFASKSIVVKTVTCDHLIPRWPFTLGIVTNYISTAIFAIMGTKHIEVTTLTFQGHGRSSVTYPFDSQVAISGASLSPKSLSLAVSEILGLKHIQVTTLTFQGHVTSSVTRPFDFQVAISYRHSIVTKSLSPAISR